MNVWHRAQSHDIIASFWWTVSTSAAGAGLNGGGTLYRLQRHLWRSKLTPLCMLQHSFERDYYGFLIIIFKCRNVGRTSTSISMFWTSGRFYRFIGFPKDRERLPNNVCLDGRRIYTIWALVSESGPTHGFGRIADPREVVTSAFMHNVIILWNIHVTVCMCDAQSPALVLNSPIHHTPFQASTSRHPTNKQNTMMTDDMHQWGKTHCLSHLAHNFDARPFRCKTRSIQNYHTLSLGSFRPINIISGQISQIF